MGMNKTAGLLAAGSFLILCLSACTKSTAPLPVVNGPINHPPVYTHKLDSVFYVSPSSTTSYAVFNYTFDIPELDTVSNPLIKLYYDDPWSSNVPSVWFEINNFNRQGRHFTYSYFSLAYTRIKTKIEAKW